jgi:hypothetical protein
MYINTIGRTAGGHVVCLIRTKLGIVVEDHPYILVTFGYN